MKVYFVSLECIFNLNLMYGPIWWFLFTQQHLDPAFQLEKHTRHHIDLVLDGARITKFWQQQKKLILAENEDNNQNQR